MSARKPPLQTMISTVVVSLNTKGDLSQPLSISGYRGENLYCHVVSDGNVLSITVDQTPGNDDFADRGATQARITVNYGPVISPPLIFNNITYSAGKKIVLKVKVTSDLTKASLYFTDTDAKQGVDGARLEFVLVDEGTLKEPRYRLEWIRNNVWVEFAGLRTDASVVEPLLLPGSAMGPMGLSTP